MSSTGVIRVKKKPTETVDDAAFRSREQVPRLPWRRGSQETSKALTTRDPATMRLITASTIGDIRAGFGSKRHTQIGQALAHAKFTLGSLLEMAAWLADSQNQDAVGCVVIRSCFRAAIEPITGVINGTVKGSVSLKGQGRAEVSSVSDLTSQDKPWLEFIIRFSEALVQAGYDRTYARALAYSLHEMGDNVRQHAGSQPKETNRSAAGWHVVGNTAAFAVVDLGRGVRASLQTNPTWAALKSDQDALLAVLKKQATRKSENTVGDGYREVVHNFVSRNGCLAVRSGVSEVAATGSVVDGAIRTSVHPYFSGTRVVAWCAPKQATLPSEPSL